MMNGQVNLSITTGTIIRTLLLLAGAWLLFYLKELVLVVLTAIVLASAVEPAARTLMRRKIPRTVAVLLVYLVFLGSFFGLFYFFVPPVLSETLNLMSTLPSFVDALNQQTDAFGSTVASFSVTNDSAISLPHIISQVRTTLAAVSADTLGAASAIFGGVLSFILIVVFSFYFAVQETGIDDFLRVITPVKNQRYVIDLWKRAQVKIGLWMQGQILLAVIVGVLVYLGLTIIGIEYALVLAVIAALFELIPVFGPVLSAVPAVVIAFGTGTAGLAFLVIALYVIIQQFENHLIYPLVVTKVVGVPPLLVILALLVGWQLAGFLGIILSVPFAAAIQEFIHDIQHRRAFVLGESDE